MSEEQIAIGPQVGPQTAFLATPADIAIMGGAAGGGKTFALLFEPLRHVANPGFGATIFRRVGTTFTQEGGMWDEAVDLYGNYPGAVAFPGRLTINFPGGAKVRFRHIQHEKDRLLYKGAQIALMCFDQVEEFSGKQFWYMLSRNRTTCGVYPYLRATCNPEPDSWLYYFLEWWIADDGYADLDRAGRLRWFVRPSDELVWANTRGELVDKYPSLLPLSVTFIPASVYDNKILLALDPGYLARLQALPLVERMQLLGDAVRGGNWKVRPEAGKVFNRMWFSIVPAPPAGGVLCRFWDLAATEKKLKGDDPDYTAGVLERRHTGTTYIEDVVAAQIGPAVADRMMIAVTTQDVQYARATGAKYRCRFEQEPGASGKREVRRLAALLGKVCPDVKAIRSTGSKLERAKGLSAQSEAGNVHLVAGDWNERWLQHMHHQPDWGHDDIMDASSGSYNDLVGGRIVRSGR